jgi:hypothetical protein
LAFESMRRIAHPALPPVTGDCPAAQPGAGCPRSSSLPPWPFGLGLPVQGSRGLDRHRLPALHESFRFPQVAQPPAVPPRHRYPPPHFAPNGLHPSRAIARFKCGPSNRRRAARCRALCDAQLPELNLARPSPVRNQRARSASESADADRAAVTKSPG